MPNGTWPHMTRQCWPPPEHFALIIIDSRFFFHLSYTSQWGFSVTPGWLSLPFLFQDSITALVADLDHTAIRRNKNVEHFLLRCEYTSFHCITTGSQQTQHAHASGMCSCLHNYLSHSDFTHHSRRGKLKTKQKNPKAPWQYKNSTREFLHFRDRRKLSFAGAQRLMADGSRQSGRCGTSTSWDGELNIQGYLSLPRSCRSQTLLILTNFSVWILKDRFKTD